MQVLIVEDSLKMRGLIRSLVTPFASEVFECDEADEAFSAYQKHQPDRVLMDLMMSDIDGIAATRLIKSCYPEAGIVIVTSHESLIDARRGEKYRSERPGYGREFVGFASIIGEIRH